MKKEEKAFLHGRKWVVNSLDAFRGVYVNHRDFVDKVQSIEKQLDPDFCKKNLFRMEHRTAKNLVYWLTKKGCKAIAEKLSAKKRLVFEERCKKLFDLTVPAPKTETIDPILDSPKSEVKSLEPYVPQTVTDFGVFEKDGKVVVSSRTVAKFFGKRHDHVLRDIDTLGCSSFFKGPNFGESFYSGEQGKTQREVLMTRDGFMFLVMGYNGATADAIKEGYINIFNTMEAQLRANTSTPSIVPNFADPVSSRLGWIAAVEKGLEFARSLDLSEKKVALLTEQIEEDAPKVDLAKAYLVAEDGDVEVGEYAQELLQKKGLKEIMVAGQLVKMGRNHLLAWFVENKHATKLRKGNGYRPIGIAKDKELIRIYNVKLRNGQRYSMLYITPTGNEYFIQELRRQESERNQVMVLTSDGLKLLPAVDPQPNTSRAKKRRIAK